MIIPISHFIKGKAPGRSGDNFATGIKRICSGIRTMLLERRAIVECMGGMYVRGGPE